MNFPQDSQVAVTATTAQLQLSLIAFSYCFLIFGSISLWRIAFSHHRHSPLQPNYHRQSGLLTATTAKQLWVFSELPHFVGVFINLVPSQLPIGA